MKKTTLAALFATIGLTTLAVPAMAYEAGDWLVRGRIINVDPNVDSGRLYADGAVVGKGVSVNSDTVPELDITYMLTRNWGVELILGFSEHTVHGNRAASGLGNVIDTKVLPPTLTLQYHFLPESNIRPYVGAGVNYTYFFDEKVAGDVLDTPGSRVKLESSWGLALQAGVDIALNNDWFVNFDVKYIDMNTQANFKNVAGGTIQRAKINADIDPFVWGVGIGRRF